MKFLLFPPIFSCAPLAVNGNVINQPGDATRRRIGRFRNVYKMERQTFEHFAQKRNFCFTNFLLLTTHFGS